MLKNLTFIQEGGDMPEPTKQLVRDLIIDFEKSIQRQGENIPPKILRVKLDGSIFIFKDKHKILAVYAPKQGNLVFFRELSENIIPSRLLDELSNWNDYNDLVVAIISGDAIDKTNSQRQAMIDAAATDLINRSLQQVQSMSGIASFNPIFGPNKFPTQSNLCFVIMPFKPKLDEIYKSIIKPCIENDIKLACRRADEISSNNAIMNDIWKSICESRFVIADLTEFNSNVMYELGICHTIGKPTILIYQETATEMKFPFDLSHIRRINYNDSASGGQKLRSDLTASVKAMLEFEI